MFCNDCGSQVPDGSKFCHQCGNATSLVSAAGGGTSGAAQATQMSPEPRTAESRSAVAEPKRSYSSRTLFLLIVLGVLGWVLYSVLSHQESPQVRRAAFMAPPAQTPVIQPVTSSLGEKAFTIPAGTYKYVKFTIPPRCSDVEIQGRFEATGGSGNDVEVVVLNEDEFTNWQNHHSVSTFYNSGRVTVATVGAHLPSTNASDSSTYYLIYSNVFSVLANKAVSTDVMLHYNRTL